LYVTHRRLRTGAAGEDLAARWYEDHGYTVVARNWRCSEGELALVLARDGLIVFSEVKTRRSNRYGFPAEAVTPLKQRRLRSLAAQFLREQRQRADRIRFDVVAILGDTIDVRESAF
jgi:putative endonuclease